MFATPRPVPGRLVPALAGSAVILLAMPVFAVAGWPLDGWLLAATLWVAGQAFAWLLTRLPLGTGNLAAAGMRGIGTSFRAMAVGIPLVVVAVAIFHLVYSWNDFFGPLIYLSSKPELQPLAVGLSRFNGIHYRNPELIQAGTLMTMIIPVVAFLLTSRFFTRGIVITGVEK